jgi:5S rRNA maturation endonuclease (ribonuclease M5)
MPVNGIYLMMEKTENNRISRIGINKRRELKTRLLRHANGNIRNSVFRRHLYKILKLEDKVSEYVKESIRFYIINDPDNRREDLEKKLISYFSNITLKNISKNWLGLKSDNKKIVSSGLWNVQHVFSKFQISSSDLRYIKENLK